MEEDGNVLFYTMFISLVVSSLIIGVVYWPQFVQIVKTWIH